MTTDRLVPIHVDHPHDADGREPFLVASICFELAETLDLAYDLEEDCGVFWLRESQHSTLRQLVAGLKANQLGYSYCGF